MSVFVAGHRGLVGSAFVRRLGASMPVVTRTRAELDLRDGAAVRRFFDVEAPTYVILSAGRVGGIVANMEEPASFLEENLAIQLNVLSSARRAGAKRVLFFGSSCMYPRHVDGAISEDMLFGGPPEPTSLSYATAKLAGVQLCLAYNLQDGGQRFVPLIPNSVYGPNDNFDPKRSHVLSALITRFHTAKESGAERVVLWGTGAPRRELVHVDDLAACGAALLEVDLSRATLPLNVGVGSDVSIRELAALVARIVGFTGRIEWDPSRPDGAPRKLLDSTRIRALGFSPAVTLEQGLSDTYRWYLANVARATEERE